MCASHSTNWNKGEMSNVAKLMIVCDLPLYDQQSKGRIKLMLIVT
jgi:hypothetical protein